jgi:hypothetical protein
MWKDGGVEQFNVGSDRDETLASTRLPIPAQAPRVLSGELKDFREAFRFLTISSMRFFLFPILAGSISLGVIAALILLHVLVFLQFVRLRRGGD